MKCVFLLGPTGVGKTSMGVRLAKAFDGEIISADSVQIYKGLDVGSAKVTKEEMDGIVHHAIDILEPEQEFSVFEFVELTKQKITEISKRGKLPIVVGGTGLYVKALVNGYDFGGTGKNEELRKKLQEIAETQGNDALFCLLQEKNPQMAQKTDRHNTVRLVRALEIALSDGEKGRSDVEVEALLFALERDRNLLYDQINRRVDEMLANGLLKEVEALKNRGLTKQNQSMHAIGYKEVLDFLDGEISYERMVELVKQHSRNYAKRQLTFLRQMQDVCHVDVENRESAFEEISQKITDFFKK